jgi:hypothetical protein
LTLLDIQSDDLFLGTITVERGTLLLIIHFLNLELTVDPESVFTGSSAFELVYTSDGRGECGLELGIPVLAESLTGEIVET